MFQLPHINGKKATKHSTGTNTYRKPEEKYPPMNTNMKTDEKPEEKYWLGRNRMLFMHAKNKVLVESKNNIYEWTNKPWTHKTYQIFNEWLSIENTKNSIKKNKNNFEIVLLSLQQMSLLHANHQNVKIINPLTTNEKIMIAKRIKEYNNSILTCLEHV